MKKWVTVQIGRIEMQSLIGKTQCADQLLDAVRMLALSKAMRASKRVLRDFVPRNATVNYEKPSTFEFEFEFEYDWSPPKGLRTGRLGAAPHRQRFQRRVGPRDFDVECIRCGLIFNALKGRELCLETERTTS